MHVVNGSIYQNQIHQQLSNKYTYMYKQNRRKNRTTRQRLTKSGDDDEIFGVGIEALLLRRQVWWRQCRADSGCDVIIVVVVVGRAVVGTGRWRDGVPGPQSLCGGRGVGRGAISRPRRLEGSDGLGVGQLVLFLPLHPSILEPDLDLTLAQTEHVSDLNAPAPRQVAVEMEFLLEFENLVLRVGRARSLAVQTAPRDAVTAVSTCTQQSAPLRHVRNIQLQSHHTWWYK